MKASDYIAAHLHARGVSHVFELVGGMITHLLDSIARRGDVRIVSVHHEQAASFAAEISEMKFPVWSRAISARGTVKATLGSVNVPVVVAGLQVTPGDVVVADDDGVVLVNRAQALDVARSGQDREKKEAATRARLQKGELGLDIYGMRKPLEEKGLKYIDGPVD